MPVVGNTWTAQGPSPIFNGQTQALPGPDPVDGAIEWIVPHPTNPDILYIATVNGGVWMTSNGTNANPVWKPLTDDQASLSMGALKFDPTDTTNKTLVAGIGRFSNLANVGEARTGILRTVDGGANWTALSGGGVLLGKNIVNVTPRGAIIVVAVDTADTATKDHVGIFRSINTGANFAQISGAAGTGLPSGVTFDLVGDPINSNILYTAVTQAGAKSGVYKSVDTGAHWSRVSDSKVNAKFSDSATENVRLAVGTSNNVYVAIGNNGILNGLFRSGNGGGGWTALDIPVTDEEGTLFGINPGQQVQPNLSIVADPGNPNLVYVAGDRQPAADEASGGTDFPNSIGADNYVGRIFRVDASKPTGSQFASETNSKNGTPAGWGTASNSAPHADSRSMAFDAVGNLIETDDGGIYKRTRPEDNSGNWFSLNNNIQVTELHSTAYDTNAHIIIGGAQDNGASQQPKTGAGGWQELLQGDGADVDTRATGTAGIWVRYSSYIQLGTPRLRQTYDASNTLLSDQRFALNVISGDPMDPGFNAPLRANAVDPSRVLFGCLNGIYESLDQGNSVSQISTSLVVNDGIDHTAMVYGGVSGGVNNPDLIIVGADKQLWTRTAAAPAAFTQISAYPGTTKINGVAVDPADSNTICAVDAAKIFCSVNGGSWADQTGALAGGGPFNTVSIGTVNGETSVLVGSDRGVFVSPLSSLGTWSVVGSGLPNAKVASISIDTAANTVMAGTIGRGAWTVALGGVTPTPTPSATPTASTSATPTATPSATPSIGAEASSTQVNAQGSPGTAVNGGTVTISNTSNTAETIDSLTISASRSAIFSQMALSSGGQTVTVTPAASSNVFTFSPPISVAAGGSAKFTLVATISGSSASLPVAYAGFGITPHWMGAVTAPGAIPLGAGLMLFGLILTGASVPNRRRLAFAALLAIGLCATAAGCSGSSNSTTFPFSKQQVTGASVNNASGSVGVGGLPASLGTITKS